MTNIKYPHVRVQLSGQDGNAFAILGRISCELRRAQVDPQEVAAFMTEATAGDYAHLLATCMAWVDAA